MFYWEVEIVWETERERVSRLVSPAFWIIKKNQNAFCYYLPSFPYYLVSKWKKVKQLEKLINKKTEGILLKEKVERKAYGMGTE